ncbi:penicillin-binding protein activator LpoB [Candidatus Fukatsuia symbiotica]|uniref:penicillin-binding protein activator LpoB n=1 Tax=Candidatus Fukatsuia TaxID=1927833 RepID=UPI000933BE64|nr:penicillin-binding protein activator LpoB [Candidatus Fukatsuia symbiotica]MEA9444687.1 penicillin-binding protein activator LpoB [Candidatus Fukatsuia symbiotica]
MKRYFFVALATLMLTGCPSQPPDVPQPPVTIKPSKPSPLPLETTPFETTPSVVETVPQVPKIQSINWAASVEPLVAKMLNANNVTAGSVLLLDSVKNNTNGRLQTSKATEALHRVLASNKKFVLVSSDRLAEAKRTLGLSEEDSLGSRSKAVGLARHVNAQYVLYSDVRGDSKAPTIDMQLMLVQTGEIIWSDDGSIDGGSF